jgi:hypothetical protein
MRKGTRIAGAGLALGLLIPTSGCGVAEDVFGGGHLSPLNAQANCEAIDANGLTIAEAIGVLALNEEVTADHTAGHENQMSDDESLNTVYVCVNGDGAKATTLLESGNQVSLHSGTKVGGLVYHSDQNGNFAIGELNEKQEELLKAFKSLLTN